MINSLNELIKLTNEQEKTITPDLINPNVWCTTEWDFMEPEKRDLVLSKILIEVIKRAKKESLYKKAYEKINMKELEKEKSATEILLQLPVLFKDNTSFGAKGFRETIKTNPYILKHGDKFIATEIFKSGGTKGIPTPTFITKRDLEIESKALGFRCFVPGGFKEKDILFTTYNPSHKGGREIQEAATHIGMDAIVKRPEDNLQDIIEIIKTYKANCIATVQPPINEEDEAQKGAGVNFLNLFKEDHELFGKDGQIKKAFITGFKVPDSVINLAKEIGLQLFTTYGCSEFIPLATSTTQEKTKCHFNDQHILYGPHMTIVVKTEDKELIPVKKGERGMVLITTLGISNGRTIFLNYAIGDTAIFHDNQCGCGRTTPIITDISRTDNPDEILSGGCRCV